MTSSNNKYDSDYTSLLISKNRIRSAIRKFVYINNVLKFVNGKTIDFGCGVGELLKYLPAQSLGVDPNISSIEYCKARKLNAEYYNPEENDYSFEQFKGGHYKTLLLNHVLEHIQNPQRKFNKILEEAFDIGINRIIVVVPCKRGFLADSTHEEYIESSFFKKINLDRYQITHQRYHPINNRLMGDLFRYQELVIVFEKKS